MTKKGPSVRVKKALSQCQTPALVFDLRRIEAKMSRLARLALPENVRLIFPVKSFPIRKILQAAGRHLHGFEISNLTELDQVSSNRKELWINSPALLERKALSQFSRAQARAVVSCDSLEQLDMMTTRTSLEFAIRINSSALLREETVRATKNAPESRFGLTPFQVSQQRDRIKTLAGKFRGFSLHHGTEVNQWIDYLLLARKVLSFAEKNNIHLRSINLGGGVGNFSERDFAQLLLNLRRIVPRGIEILFEPGLFWTLGNGYGVGTVVGRKKFPAVSRYFLDLSESSHLRWSRPEILKSYGKEKAEFFGPTCYERDFMCEATLPRALEPGDRVIFSGVSGYSAAWNTSFNGIPLAKIILVRYNVVRPLSQVLSSL